VTKDELRAELERQAERYKEVYGGEVTPTPLNRSRSASLGEKGPRSRTRPLTKNWKRWKRSCAATNP